MQRDRLATARTWLSNAAIDLALATEIATGYAARACFHAQQSCEFALKGVLIALADDHPRTHVGSDLVRQIIALDCDVPGPVVIAAKRLDVYHVGSRYVDALGGADPSEAFVEDDARAAIELARLVVDFARHAVDIEANAATD